LDAIGIAAQSLRWIGVTFLRIVIPLYLFDLSMIFSENRYPLFRIML